MQEYSVPPVVTVSPTANLTDAVFANADGFPTAVAFSRKLNGAWASVTTREFAADVRKVAGGLVASGLAPGDRVALMSKTRYEWTVCDYAIWTAGGVTVPIYETSSAEQVEWILSDSEAVIAIVESPGHIALVEEVRAKTPALREVFSLDAGGIDTLATAGAAVTDSDIATRRTALVPETLATIVYTSGTTGRSKGCEITHGNLLFDVMTTTADMGDLFNAETGSTLMFLPLAHIFGRIIQCGCVINRVRMGHTSDIKNLVADFAEFKPTFILSVPRIFEKLYNTFKQIAYAGGKGKIFDAGEAAAIAYSEALETPGGPNIFLKARHAVFDRILFVRLRAGLGGQAAYAVSGGGPLGARLGHFFRGIGINVLEGYGLTESSAGATINLPGRQKIGTVGRPIAGVTVQIAEDGEILLKGANIFSGYWHNETATKEVIEDDGFFRTGDIGTIDDQGFVKITGRKKELIVTAGGKNVAPAVLEDRLRANPLVSQCVVVGDAKPFIGCLVTIDPDSWPAWLSAHGKPADTTIASMVADPDLRADISLAVDDANKAVSHAEAIKSFRILAVDFTEEGGQLTPSLKVKRNVVHAEFAQEIEAIYAGSKGD